MTHDQEMIAPASKAKDVTLMLLPEEGVAPEHEKLWPCLPQPFARRFQVVLVCDEHESRPLYVSEFGLLNGYITGPECVALGNEETVSITITTDIWDALKSQDRIETEIAQETTDEVAVN